MKSILSIFLVLMLLGCANSSSIKDEIPAHETLNIRSELLNENRVINVWLPTEYENSTTKYDVLYMADGGVNEDFPHIALTLSELIAAKKIPPMILVGIENTQRRRDLTGPTEVAQDKKVAPVVGGSAKFRAFVNDELIPEINQKFRTSAKKGIIGESLSGLFVVETLMQNPEMFDFYIAMDPSLWWNNHFLVSTAQERLAQFPSKEIKFWFAGSNAQDIFQYTRQLEAILKTNSPKNLLWKYADEPQEKHQTIFRATKAKALQWTLQSNP